MRERSRILNDLEKVYRGAFGDAERRDDQEGMGRLDFEFQRDQLVLEVFLDLRDLLAAAPAGEGESSPTLLERAKALKDLTKLR